jgi:uncharacterized protein YbjQ (UPF0145 family)
MTQKPYSFQFLSLLCVISLSFSCKNQLKQGTYYSPNYKDGSTERHDGLGFEIPRKYEIDIVYFNETPKQTFEVIESLTLTQEIPLGEKQTQNGKMLYRGNHQTEKQNLLNKMIESALVLGASALIDVKYQVFSTATTTGYTFTGKAVRYVLK